MPSSMQMLSPKSDKIKKSAGSVSGDEDKVARLVRERSTAQRRRQCKREEMTTLGASVQEYEVALAKLHIRLESMTEAARQEVLAMQAQVGPAPLACRLCSILDRREEYHNAERLVQHLRTHHASELRHRGPTFDIVKFGTEVPPEDAMMSGEEDDSDMEDEVGDSPDNDCSQEAKRKMRLKRNAASARKSRRRKRVQLERWRMLLPILRFQVESLQAALDSVPSPNQANRKSAVPQQQQQQQIQHMQPVMPVVAATGFQASECTLPADIEPDVVSAAYALIGCSLSAKMAVS